MTFGWTVSLRALSRYSHKPLDVNRFVVLVWIT